MPCYRMRPSVLVPRPDGKNTVLFRFGNISKLPAVARLAPIPCGQCIGCRLERSRQWAVRLCKEQKSHDHSSFLTLTFNDKKLPRLKSGTPTLNKDYFTNFMKRLRKALEPQRVRFFQCGEYGDKTLRPHHHMILFGTNFSKDRFEVEPSRSGFPQWESPLLTAAWDGGRCTISDMSFESAAYVARYNLKKQTGAGADFHYHGRVPEYVTMSRRPGIGSQFFMDYTKDIYPDDHVIVDGRASMPPKYFDKLLERTDPELYEAIKAERQKDLDYYSDPNNTDTRLEEREKFATLQTKNTLKREI